MTLHLEDVHATLGRRPVLHGVSFDAEPGKILAIVGPNGAGKTTLLRAAGGLQHVTDGRIKLDGDEIHRISARERAKRLAYVPQDAPIDEPFTVRDLLVLARYAHMGMLGGTDEGTRDAIEEALRRTELSPLAGRDASRLSRGQRQNLLLGRALAQGSPTLLLDEPTAHLDLGQKHRTLRLMRELAREGKTLVVVLHDLEEAASLADRLLLLVDGKIVAQGSATEALSPTNLRHAFSVDAELILEDGVARINIREP